GRLTYATPPFVPEGSTATAVTAANALPQALILTAIVIGFGLLAFALALAFRAWQSLGTVEMDAMRACEPLEPPTPPVASTPTPVTGSRREAAE
ncbi:NADH-quinone oxidoreductase subunit K, partial [Vibrio sp. 404]|nr:NADH-quinone oxidoreductase subunit K [Vibrio marinisediminis]